ncbi:MULTISPECIES: DUF2946 family protein [Herbaspirillum]|jgi:hypothetical protein|uniref:DUF2946 family protein n=1 Tax=Herbaspirillum TaxID=963 RepID=UPI00034D7B95|nr:MULTISPECIES: DUF2946 family protein [Herbaspirillum]MCP1576054.1 hypothetical protein [Herbaspirillum rubrisubalbicans]
MDEIVRQAMARWPNVPHCFGWLRLDARGLWRMRDERAQQLELPGDPIRHPALLAFIDRNYGCDDAGRWYFQNGPQRVYVDLEWMPHILRTQPDGQGGLALVLHTGATLEAVEAAWMDEAGRLYLRAGGVTAGVDDRDLAHLLPCLQTAGAADEEALLRWLEGAGNVALNFTYAGRALPLKRIAAAELEKIFTFVANPREP